MTEKEIIGTFFNKVLHNKKTNMMIKPCLTNKLYCKKICLLSFHYGAEGNKILQIWRKGNFYYHFIYKKL